MLKYDLSDLCVYNFSSVAFYVENDLSDLCVYNFSSVAFYVEIRSF